jgi:hypothetical protein
VSASHPVRSGAATLAVLLLLGCSAAASSSVPSPSLPSLIPTAAPTERVDPTMASTLDPPTPEPPIEMPPLASLAVEGGDPVVGELGSFAWQNAGSDSPWLPGSPMRIGAGEPLELSIAGEVGIDSWQVNYVPADDLDSITPVGLGDGGGAPITFSPPPPGTWSVHVGVRFADGLGSAAYYWSIEVD